MEKREPSYTVGGNIHTLVQSLWKTIRRFLKKLKIELPYDPAIPLLGIYPDKTIIKRIYMLPYIHSSTVHHRQDGNNPHAHGQMDG